MIRITASKHENASEIRVEGELIAESLEQLRAVTSDQRGKVRVNVAGVTRVDRLGGAFLRELESNGHSVVGASLYLRRLLEEVCP